MPTFKATSPEGVITDYTADVIDPLHFSVGWRIEQIIIAEASPDAPEPVPTTKYDGRRVLSKIEFRRLFPDATRHYVDEFNATFESHPALTTDQKRSIRSGLEDYKATNEVNLDDPSTAMMVGLYQMLGILTADEAQGVLNG
jgi:hypothetical protein